MSWWIDGSVSGGKYRLLLPQLAAAAAAAHAGGLALDSRVTVWPSIRVEGQAAIVLPPAVNPSGISLSRVQSMLVGRMEKELHELAARRPCSLLLSSEALSDSRTARSIGPYTLPACRALVVGFEELGAAGCAEEILRRLLSA